MSQPAPAERQLYLDDEPAAPARGRSRSGLWVGLVVLLAAAVGVALGWPQIAPLLGLAEAAQDPAAPHADAGDEALAADTVEGYERAITHYTQALAFNDHSVRVLTGLSRAHALWAQAIAFEADDLAARAGDDPTLAGQALAMRTQQQSHAQSAMQFAEDAVRHDADVPAEVALADASRLTGDLDLARRRLDRALTLSETPSAETLRAEGLLRAAEADGDLTRAREDAEAAVAEDPALIRARLLLARSLLAARDVSGARAQIAAVLRRAARHPAALALQTAIDQGLPPAPPTLEVPDGGVAQAAEPGDPPEATDAPVTASRRDDDEREESGGGVPRGRDYGYYVQHGDELLRTGRVDQARAMFDAARAIRPGGSEALAGLGYVDLENGNANAAVDKFRDAARQGYADAYIGLGAAYRRLGNNQNALTAYERYLERLPGGPRASIAQRQVEELRRLLGNAPGGETPSGGTPSGETPAPDTPPNTDGTLPPPREPTPPPPEDVPAVGSEP